MRLKDLDTDIPYRTANAIYSKEKFIKSFANVERECSSFYRLRC